MLDPLFDILFDALFAKPGAYIRWRFGKKKKPFEYYENDGIMVNSTVFIGFVGVLFATVSGIITILKHIFN